MTTGEKILEIARKEIGVQEEPPGSNTGPRVKEYLKAVEINTPAFWCMAFVMWCIRQVIGITTYNLMRTGHVMTFYRWVKKNRPQWIVTDPQPGDIGILKFPNDHGHTFIVESVHGDHIDTIEGNSNDEGSRNGQEVAHRTIGLGREIKKTFAFVRIP